MKKLLIVVDMQKDFIDGSLGTKEAEAVVAEVRRKIEAYEKAGDEVVFTMDTHFDDYLDTQEGRNLPVKHCIKGTDGWRLCEELEGFAGGGSRNPLLAPWSAESMRPGASMSPWSWWACARISV